VTRLITSPRTISNSVLIAVLDTAIDVTGAA